MRHVIFVKETAFWYRSKYFNRSDEKISASVRYIDSLKDYSCICIICTLLDRFYLVVLCECYDLPNTNWNLQVRVTISSAIVNQIGLRTNHKYSQKYGLHNTKMQVIKKSELLENNDCKNNVY